MKILCSYVLTPPPPNYYRYDDDYDTKVIIRYVHKRRGTPNCNDRGKGKIKKKQLLSSSQQTSSLSPLKYLLGFSLIFSTLPSPSWKSWVQCMELSRVGVESFGEMFTKMHAFMLCLLRIKHECPSFLFPYLLSPVNVSVSFLLSFPAFPSRRDFHEERKA